MTTLARVVVTDVPRHVTRRGTRRLRAQLHKEGRIDIWRCDTAPASAIIETQADLLEV